MNLLVISVKRPACDKVITLHEFMNELKHPIYS
jgi:hypothetical protein